MTKLLLFLMLPAIACFGELPRPELAAASPSPGHCVLTFQNAFPAGVVQIQRYSCGRKDSRWTFPSMLMNRYQMANKPEMCSFEDSGVILNVTPYYRIRWFNGNEASPWSKKAYAQ